MNSRERVLTALRGEQPDRVPFVEGQVDPPIQRALVDLLARTAPIAG